MLKLLAVSAGIMALAAGCQDNGGYYNQGYPSQAAVPQSGYYSTSPVPQPGYYRPVPHSGSYSPGPPPGQYESSRYDGCSDNTAIGTVAGAAVGGLVGNSSEAAVATSRQPSAASFSAELPAMRSPGMDAETTERTPITITTPTTPHSSSRNMVAATIGATRTAAITAM
jgi:hypothetical protein